jgi:unsaturated chondroitin disaccharide hydrolase
MTAGVWTEAIERMLGRIADTAARVGDRFPHWADPGTGEWTTTTDGDWTGGYWIGMLWLAASSTGEARYRSWAQSFVARLGDRVAAQTVFKSFPVYLFESLLALAGRIDPLRV